MILVRLRGGGDRDTGKNQQTVFGSLMLLGNESSGCPTVMYCSLTSSPSSVYFAAHFGVRVCFRY